MVTGGASGIGAACAARLAAAGASILIADLDEQAAAKVAADVGGRPYAVDLAADSFDPDALAARADVLVNCAGLQHVAPVHEFPLDRYRLLMTVMLEAPFRLARAALPHMYSQGYGLMLTEPGIKRLIGPSEVAELTAYMCSPAASFANGSSFVLDGGLSAR